MNALPLPSPRQLAWHEKPFYGFVHLSPNTFTGLEWGYGVGGRLRMKRARRSTSRRASPDGTERATP